MKFVPEKERLAQEACCDAVIKLGFESPKVLDQSLYYTEVENDVKLGFTNVCKYYDSNLDEIKLASITGYWDDDRWHIDGFFDMNISYEDWMKRVKKRSFKSSNKNKQKWEE